MIKHAYCIIAHTDPYTLKTLIDLIDDERNDIFILFDKKVKQSSFGKLNAYKSQIITPHSLNALIFNGVINPL